MDINNLKLGILGGGQLGKDALSGSKPLEPKYICT